MESLQGRKIFCTDVAAGASNDHWQLSSVMFYVNFVPVVYILYYSCVGNKLFQELVELVRTKKLAQAAAASTKKN